MCEVLSECGFDMGSARPDQWENGNAFSPRGEPQKEILKLFFLVHVLMLTVCEDIISLWIFTV